MRRKVRLARRDLSGSNRSQLRVSFRSDGAIKIKEYLSRGKPLSDEGLTREGTGRWVPSESVNESRGEGGDHGEKEDKGGLKGPTTLKMFIRKGPHLTHSSDLLGPNPTLTPLLLVLYFRLLPMWVKDSGRVRIRPQKTYHLRHTYIRVDRTRSVEAPSVKITPSGVPIGGGGGRDN